MGRLAMCLDNGGVGEGRGSPVDVFLEMRVGRLAMSLYIEGAGGLAGDVVH